MVQLCHGINFVLPTIHKDDWSVDAEGNSAHWLDLGKITLGPDEWPVRFHFDSEEESNSAFVGGCWWFPLLEAKVIRLDKRRVKVFLPCGRELWFSSRDGKNPFVGVNTKSWTANFDGRNCTISTSRWKVNYRIGKIWAMQSSEMKGKSVTWNYAADGTTVNSISYGGEKALVVKYQGTKNELVCQKTGANLKLHLEEASAKGNFYADRELLKVGKLLTKAVYKNGEGKESHFEADYAAAKMEHEYLAKDLPFCFMMLKKSFIRIGAPNEDKTLMLAWDLNTKLAMGRVYTSQHPTQLKKRRIEEIVRSIVVKRSENFEFMVVTPPQGINGTPKIFKSFWDDKNGLLKGTPYGMVAYYNHSIAQNMTTEATVYFYPDDHEGKAKSHYTVRFKHKHTRDKGKLYNKDDRTIMWDCAKVSPQGVTKLPDTLSLRLMQNFYDAEGELLMFHSASQKYRRKNGEWESFAIHEENSVNK